MSCELNYVEQQRTDADGLDVHPPRFADPDGIEAWTFPETDKVDAPAYSPYGDRIIRVSTAAPGVTTTSGPSRWLQSQESSYLVLIGSRVQLD